MKLTFLGADREVTGSCTQLEAAGHRFLIDCGMEQGRDVYENADLPCAPGTYEALLLTHAHIDHSGRIPYLYKNGYRGPIYTTDATRDLCAIMLEDSAHIQEQEAEWKNRKAMRSGAEMIEPDYTVEDAQNVMKQFVPCPYEVWQTLFDGPTGKIEMRFTDVGTCWAARPSRCALRSRAAHRRSSFSRATSATPISRLSRTRPTRATRITLSWNPPTGTAATDRNRIISAI